MTVKEMFEDKYKEYMKNITPKAWENAKYYAEHKNMPVYKFIFLCLELTQHDLKKMGGQYCGELEELHKQKCIASNRHRQEHGHVDKYWLTQKGYRKMFEA